MAESISGSGSGASPQPVPDASSGTRVRHLDGASPRRRDEEEDHLDGPPRKRGKLADEESEEVSTDEDSGPDPVAKLQKGLARALRGYAEDGDAQEFFNCWDAKSQSLNFPKEDSLFWIIEPGVGEALASAFEVMTVIAFAFFHSGMGVREDEATFAEICQALDECPRLGLIDFKIEMPEGCESWADVMRLLDMSRLSRVRVFLHPSDAFELAEDFHFWVLPPHADWPVYWYGDARGHPDPKRFPSIEEAAAIHVWGIPYERVHFLSHRADVQVEKAKAVDAAGDSKSATRDGAPQPAQPQP